MTSTPLKQGGLRRTRVLHIIQNLNYGGMERLVADIVARVDRSRFESHILCIDYLGRFARDLEAVATLHTAPPQSRWSMLWPRAMASLIRRIRPDVVHSHSGVWYKSAWAARLAGVRRIVHTEHGRRLPDPPLHRLLDGAAAFHTDVVVAVSEVLADQLARTVVGSRARLTVVRNGVDTTRYRPHRNGASLERELGFDRSSFVLGSIGRLQPIKGYDVMVEAFSILLASAPLPVQPIAIVAGEGPERPALEARIRELGLEARFRILGWRDDIESLHGRFDAFTMSSRSEGTSVSLLEGMSAGLCPVVTDVGGNAAVLGAELRHRLVPSEDPAALAAAWRNLIVDGAARQRDAEASRRRVEERFGVDAMVRSYELLYAGET